MTTNLILSSLRDALTKPDYDPARDIPEQSRKVALVTGSSSGIGYETSKQLAAHGAKVYLACRSKEKALAAIQKLEEELPDVKKDDRIQFLQVDMSDMGAVKRAADEFTKRERRLDILIHNAGRMTSPYELSKDGVELSIAVNHLGVAALTDALMPLLKSTATEPDSDVRIVVVSSRGHADRPESAKLDSLEGWNAYGGFKDDSYNSQRCRYGMTKYMNILYVAGLQKELDKQGLPITAIALHPGLVWTEGIVKLSPWYVLPGMRALALSQPVGAYTSLFAATSPLVKQQRDTYKGKYLVPFGRVAQPDIKDASDKSSVDVLWNTTCKILADVFGHPRP